MKHSTGLRFESREIAVILSLFIFVSLLMFTVGIVIGKGLAQAKYEGEMGSSSAALDNLSRVPSSQTGSGSSVSINSPITQTKSEPPVEPDSSTSKPAVSENEPLRLEPKVSDKLSVHPDWDTSELNQETDSLLNNPVISDLFEKPQPTQAKQKEGLGITNDVVIEKDFSNLQSGRETASLNRNPSSPSGPYSVQIAAYSERDQAEDRVEALKKLGYSHAYVSSVDIGEQKETWFRVWLGYYPSLEAAKKGGQELVTLGEVKNFLVRKTQKTGTKN